MTGTATTTVHSVVRIDDWESNPIFDLMARNGQTDLFKLQMCPLLPCFLALPLPPSLKLD